MIEARNLSKEFASVRAVHDVSFRVDRGEAVGFLGPNGAGKTTTFRMLSGTLSPSRGQVLVQGHDLVREPIASKRSMGYMPEVAPLYPEMTVREYLNYRAELRGVRSRDRKKTLERAAEGASSEHHLGTIIGHLSKGYRRRVALADALLGDPPILLLDEPTAGLDPNQVLEVRKLILRLAKEHTILVSTHVLSEVEATCSRAIVIQHGRLVAQGTLDELQRSRIDKRARLVLAEWTEETKAGLVGLLAAHRPDWNEREDRLSVTFDSTESDLLSRVVEHALLKGAVLSEATQERAALDDVFAQLTRSPREER